MEYDEIVLETFLKNQGKLFDENVAETLEEAKEFLEDCMALVFPNIKEVRKCWKKKAWMLRNFQMKELKEELEVFEIPERKDILSWKRKNKRNGGNMKRKQVMILFMTALLLTGCGKDIKLTTGLAKNEIFKIQGETEELAEVTLVLVNEKNSYENSLGQDIWNRTFDGISLENEIKEKVKKQLIELFVIHQMAKKDGMTLSDGDKEQIGQAADTYFAEIPDEERQKLGITRDIVYHFYEKLYLTDLYYEKKTKDEGKEISDEDARVIKVMYIYFKTGEKDIYGNVSPYEESKVAAIKDKALDILDKVNQGGDFQSLAAEYSDSSQYQSVFGRGTMQESFEEAAFSLTSGQSSGLVEAEDGYYIIKCVNDYLEKETEENKESMRKKHKAGSLSGNLPSVSGEPGC